jgi:mRNA interferase HicA
MSYNEFLRWLLAQGVKVEDGKGRHYKKASFNGITVPVPYHGAKEMGEGIVNKIKKELGLK